MLRRRIAVSAFCLALSLALTSCGDNTGPKVNTSLAGTWRGTSGGLTFTMALTQQGTSVAGSGSIASIAGSATTTITGTLVGANATLTIRAIGFPDATFTGALNDRRLIGWLTTSVFTGGAFTFTKQFVWIARQLDEAHRDGARVSLVSPDAIP